MSAKKHMETGDKSPALRLCSPGVTLEALARGGLQAGRGLTAQPRPSEGLGRLNLSKA